MGLVKHVAVFFVLLMMGLPSVQDYETISWSSNKLLFWGDFRGDIPKNARAAAITASGITYSFSTSGTQDNLLVDFKIYTSFYPTKSWYKPELCDDRILSHEQLHFDISELYASKMRKRLQNETFSYGSVKAKVKSIYREINEELDDFQKQYDEETNFSRNSAKQEEWIMKIHKALEED